MPMYVTVKLMVIIPIYVHSFINQIEILLISDKKFFKKIGKKFPLIGVGGINSGATAYEKIKSGASLLQLYTGLVFRGPFVITTIKQELSELLRKDGFSSLKEAIGVDCK